MHCNTADQLTWFTVAVLDIAMLNTDLVSYCRIDLPSSHPGDDLWQNKQPFGPSSLSAVTLFMEICGLNQRSDDTQPSVVVLSVFGHEVERKHTITELKKRRKKAKQSRYNCTRTHTYKNAVCTYYARQMHVHNHKCTQHTHTPPPSVPRVTHPEIAELRPFQFFTS